MLLVDRLEAVDVEEAAREGVALAGGALDLGGEHLEDAFVPETARELVDPGRAQDGPYGLSALAHAEARKARVGVGRPGQLAPAQVGRTVEPRVDDSKRFIRA